MDKQWPPEPWKSWEDNEAESQYITDADFKPITLAPDHFDDATRDRLVACVNACTGVSAETLERWGAWMNKYQEVCPKCGGRRTKVTTVGLQVDDKMEKYTQFLTLCNECDGIGRVEKEADED